MSNLKYTNLPAEASNEDALAQLALDLSWPGRHATGVLWERLNPELWEMTHSPWAVLQTVSTKRLEEITSDPVFQKALAGQTEARGAAAESSWFHRAHAGSPLSAAAYFSMEYMLSEALPIYSGGLGNVAGDQLKAANDLGVPVIAVGLLYDQGYFRQEIDRDGSTTGAVSRTTIRPIADHARCATPTVNGCGLPYTFPVPDSGFVPGKCKLAGPGSICSTPTIPPTCPSIAVSPASFTAAAPDLRLRQEHVLGIAGWRLLRLLGIRPEVCHLNEGHAAFAVLERAAGYMEDTGHPFDVALTVTRAGNLFTTHTAVEAGFDRFPADLMYTHFGDYCGRRLRISFDAVARLGAAEP